MRIYVKNVRPRETASSFVKGACYSSGRLGFDSQQPHSSSQPTLTLVPRDPVLFLAFQCMAYM